MASVLILKAHKGDANGLTDGSGGMSDCKRKQVNRVKCMDIPMKTLIATCSETDLLIAKIICSASQVHRATPSGAPMVYNEYSTEWAM